MPVILLVMLDQHRTDRIGRYRGSGGLRHDRPAKPDRDCNSRRDGLQPRRAHLPRGANAETVTRHHESLATVDALEEVGHEVAERTCLPAFVEPVEALRDAVVGGRDLVGVDRV